MFVPCFVVQCFVSFLVFNVLLDGEERAGCFTLFVFLVSCDFFMRRFLTVPWVDCGVF